MMATPDVEELLQEHEEILLDHSERILVLESSTAAESQRLDSLCRQLGEFSRDMKDMMKKHEERIAWHDLEAVKKGKDLELLLISVKGILSMLKWAVSSLLLLLAGFFIWYVQHLG